MKFKNKSSLKATISTLYGRLVLLGIVEAVEQHRRFSVAVWKIKTSVRKDLTLFDVLLSFSLVSIKNFYRSLYSGKTPGFPNINLV